MLKCQYKQRTPNACRLRARLYIRAFGGKSWDGYYCWEHGPKIMKLRMRLIKQNKQNVVVRLVTEWDKKRHKERKAARK